MTTKIGNLIFLTLFWCTPQIFSQIFRLPTDNNAIFETNGGEKYYVGTPGKPWTSGMFGCVRSEGFQIHEGIDIKCLKRNSHGEPLDPIYASADGTVAYINSKPALSNYGRYIVIKHFINGLEIYTLYAHLAEIAPNIKPGINVKAGQTIAKMGRSTNTKTRISKERAHLHFEICLLINDKFPQWFSKNFPHERNDHSVWNGQNLVSIDPTKIFLQQAKLGSNFNLRVFIQSLTPMFSVVVNSTNFSFIRRYPGLIKMDQNFKINAFSGFEVVFDFNGVPIMLIPTSEKISGQFALKRVSEDECNKNPGRKFLVKKGEHWALTNNGKRWIDLLLYN
jgi:murein DD-endopeptidase MepM/ murein hydrolase activator NlpD